MSRIALALLPLWALALLGAGPVLGAGPDAPDETQVQWAPDWEAAFAEARASDRPVMVCINSKDGESANERAAKTTYHDPDFVALSRRFVMLVVSTHTHALSEGAPCPRFGVVTCKQHLDCWKELRNRYGDVFILQTGSGAGEMISPQHAWFRSDGTLIRRKEYELTKAELLSRMHAVLEGRDDEVAPGKEAGAGDPVPPPGGGFRDAPLDERDQLELQRVKEEEKEDRRAAIENLLSTGKRLAYEALLALLDEERDGEIRADIVRGFGKQNITESREHVELAMKDKDPLVRSCAAVALETFADSRSVEALIERIKRERETAPRRNMVLALGACGGGAGEDAAQLSEDAAKQLFKTMNGDRQVEIRKYAALAMRRYEGPNAKFVLAPLEKVAGKIKDRTVRGAMVYTLAYIGVPETTLPVLQQIYEEQTEDVGRIYLRTAINLVKGEGGDFGRSTWFLFRELRDDPAR